MACRLSNKQLFQGPQREDILQTAQLIIKTNITYIVKYSQDQFRFKLPSELIPNRTAKVVAKLLCLKVGYRTDSVEN